VGSESENAARLEPAPPTTHTAPDPKAADTPPAVEPGQALPPPRATTDGSCRAPHRIRQLLGSGRASSWPQAVRRRGRSWWWAAGPGLGFTRYEW